MNVIAVASVERFRASSDFELKLVTTIPGGMASVFTSTPPGVIWSRRMGDVTPQLPSALSLFHTLLVLEAVGYAPLSLATALPQDAVEGHSGGSFCPAITVVASPVYTLCETTRFPAVNPPLWP